MPKEISPLGGSAEGGKQPEDIFAEVEEAKPVEEPQPQREIVEEIKPLKKRNKLWLIILIAVLIILGFWFGFPSVVKQGLLRGSAYLKSFGSNLFKKAGEGNQNKKIEESNNKGEEKININISDRDKDGLSDEEEISLGTNPDSADSDLDGLTDKEEVKIYQTNPNNPDTDSDGLKDGEEVRQGLDPKDPTPGAKLVDLQKAIRELK